MHLSKLELVRKIQALLSDESKWCQRAAARDGHGLDVPVTDPKAVSFDIYGAARKVLNFGVGQLNTGGPFWEVMRDIGQYDPTKPFAGTIALYNDSHSYIEVMERLKEVEKKYSKESFNAISTV